LDSETAEDADAPCFEDALTELEGVVHELEDGQLGLGDALARYEHGIKRLKHCYQLLQEAERKIELLTGVAADGTPITQPFDAEAAPLEESAGRRRTRKATPPTRGTAASSEDDAT
jgi:exodeoxyribonuclease VII small subunit